MRYPTVAVRVVFLVSPLLVLFGIMLWHETILAQPPVPHSLEGRENCLACHETGAAGAPQIPENHAGRTIEMCPACHLPAEPGIKTAPSIPHTLEGRENCIDCHQIAQDGGEPEVEAVIPTAVPPPIPTPIAYPAVQTTSNTCVDCHAALGGKSEQIVGDWQVSVHTKRGVICADCHGGDPNAEGVTESMSVEAGFIGIPDRADIPSLCGSCHANVTLMRQYDLPTDQYTKYQESIHGQKLNEGDIKVATCFDCHDEHATHETNDPRSSVYRLNVPDLCAGCHADEDYMAEYDIPTNQYALYQTSVHGTALLEHQDVRAPNCATCHGTHGAAPPGFAEVANVCGNCHDATQNYFLSGAHNSDNPDAPRCVTCHGRYDVTEPSEAMFLGNEERHCGNCHDPSSEIGNVVTAMYQALSEADNALEAAEDAAADAAARGMIITEEQSLIAEARTKLITARANQHSVILTSIRDASDESIALSQQAQSKAEDAIAESLFRRQAMVIAIAVIGLIIASLLLLRKELATD